MRNNNGIKFIVRILTKDLTPFRKAQEALKEHSKVTKERINDHIDNLSWENFLRNYT